MPAFHFFLGILVTWQVVGRQHWLKHASCPWRAYCFQLWLLTCTSLGLKKKKERKLIFGLKMLVSVPLNRPLLFIILKSTHNLGECSRRMILFEVAALSKVFQQEILSTLVILGAPLEFFLEVCLNLKTRIYVLLRWVLCAMLWHVFPGVEIMLSVNQAIQIVDSRGFLLPFHDFPKKKKKQFPNRILCSHLLVHSWLVKES